MQFGIYVVVTSRKKSEGTASERSNGGTKKIAWGSTEDNAEIEVSTQKDANVVTEKANFGLTGALAKDELTGNMKNNVVLKWSAPLDEAMPGKYWRLYVFKEEAID